MTDHVLTPTIDRLHEALSIDTVGVLLFDRDWRIVDANDAFLRMSGYSRREVESRHLTWEQLTAPEWLEESRKAVAEFEAGGRTTPYDGRLGVVCYFRDISSEVRIREALTEADRQKDEFIATLSHELRNPLASICSASELLQRADVKEAQREWAGRVIQRQSGAMSRLLEDLLDVSRLTLGRMVLQRQRVSLASVLESALDATRPVIDAANHTVSITMPPASVTVDVDPVRLGQVVANLLGNAVKYTDAGGHIAVGVDVGAEEVVLSVKDSGIGIDPASIERMFRMFTQADDAQRRSEGGLGIGLALVRGIVELHGGWVRAESEGAGKGTTFRVGLPRIAAGTAAVDPEPTTQTSGTSSARVLVADDNKDVAESLAMLLRLNGHDVRVATSGTQALQEAERFRPDVAVLDIGMPGVSGYEVARGIRAAPWGAGMSLFAATGWGQERDKTLAKEAGFDTHLTKPVDFDQLLRLIGSCGARTGGGSPR